MRAIGRRLVLGRAFHAGADILAAGQMAVFCSVDGKLKKSETVIPLGKVKKYCAITNQTSIFSFSLTTWQ